MAKPRTEHAQKPVKAAETAHNPEGSHEAHREKLEKALHANVPGGIGESPSIRNVHPDHVIVESGKWEDRKHHKVPYSADGHGGFAFGKAEPVQMEKVVVPCAEGAGTMELVYRSDVVELGAESMPLFVVESAGPTPERTTQPDKDLYHVVFYESGTYKPKRRTYLDSAVESTSPAKYNGLKMYLNHRRADGTLIRENEPIGARAVEDMVARSVDAWHGPGIKNPAGKAMHGMVHVFPGPHAERMRDPLFRQSVELSHLAGLKGRWAAESGARKQDEQFVVSEIGDVIGADFVTEGGARGVIPESATNEENTMDWTKLDAETLKANRPDLVQAIEDSAIAAHKVAAVEEGATSELQTQLTTEKARADAAEAKARHLEIKTKVDMVVSAEGSGIPKDARTAVADRVTSSVEQNLKDAAKLDETVTAAVESEKAYLATATGKPKPVVPASGKGPEAGGETGHDRTAARIMANIS